MDFLSRKPSKKNWLLSLSVVCLLFVGCQQLKVRQARTREWMGNTTGMRVLCTTEYVAALVRSVGGEAVDVLVLIDGPNDPHSYQLVKGDNEKFSVADVIFSSGLGLERGSSCARALRHYQPFAVGDYIGRVCGTTISLGSTIDPHVWMDLSLWACGLYGIADRLSQLRPDLSNYFFHNAIVSYERIMNTHSAIRSLLQTIPEDCRYLVTTHDAFQYFCRAYLASVDEQRSDGWKKRCMAPEGLAPESQLSTHEIEMVVAYIERHHLPTIFAESGMSQDSIQKIIDVCRSQGHNVTLSKDLLRSDTIDTTYEQTMEETAHSIYEALTLV